MACHGMPDGARWCLRDRIAALRCCHDRVNDLSKPCHDMPDGASWCRMGMNAVCKCWCQSLSQRVMLGRRLSIACQKLVRVCRRLSKTCHELLDIVRIGWCVFACLSLSYIGFCLSKLVSGDKCVSSCLLILLCWYFSLLRLIAKPSNICMLVLPNTSFEG